MSNSSRSRIDPAIIAAVIGVCGTIAATLIALFANQLVPTSAPPTPTTALGSPTWTVAPTITDSPEPVPTDTVPVGDPTSTPAPDTPTPEPTFTLAPPRIGEDWRNGCISVLWQPYPPVQTTQNNLCLSEPVHYFFAADGRLTYLVNGRFDDTLVYGMFAPLPAAGTASIDVFLKNLQEGEIWMGVFAEPDINSQGMIMVIPPGNVNNRLLIQKTMPGQIELQSTASFAPGSPVYNVVFEFGNGSVRTIIMRDTVFEALPVGSDQQWLFVGFQVKRGNNRIDAEFLNLLIQEQP
ncbi:MAG TPA: hypothetical protein VFO91_13775 [Anaerolineales bacterium]|nr:hypothetical protein [Anaerolineales bacterium]